jgi:L-ascorbate metabolism protein UlaG (beta-lactamase superfamily)
LDLTWLGNRCFSVRGRDVTVVTDPDGEAIDKTLKGQEITAITLSRPHMANGLSLAGGRYPHVVNGPGEYEVANVFLTGVGTPYHIRSDEGEITREKNTVYTIELESLVVCHLGELNSPLTSEHTERLSEVSVLLVPIGDPDTFRPAMDTISLLEPKLVIPMAYPWSNPKEEEEPDTLKRFIKEMGAKEYEVQRRLHVTPTSLPQQTQAVILEDRS